MNSTHIRDSPPPLRAYQQEAIDTMFNYEGESALLVLGTGLGKTRIFTDFVRQQVVENKKNILLLSHRSELVYQPLDYLQDLRCGVELAKKQADFEHHNIISASVQSLVGRLRKYNPRETDIIIVDEAHHAAAPTYRKIIEYFQSAQLFGFTATSRRGDGIGLSCVFDDLIFEKDTLWGIKNGFLTPVECTQVRLIYNIGSVKISEFGDFNQNDVARVMSGTAAGVVEAYEKFAKGQTIIFAASIEEAKDITTMINQKTGKKTAVSIFGNTKKRDLYLNAFDIGAIKVLVNFGVLTEGVDLPCTETVIVARPISHKNIGLYAQMVGRGLRQYRDKKVCRIIDCVGISESPLCTAATLIGKDIPAPKEVEKDTKPKELEPEKDNTIILENSQIPDTWFRSTKDVNIMEKAKDLNMHDVSWIKNEDGSYSLFLPKTRYETSIPLEDGTVFLTRNGKTSQTSKPVQFIFDFVFEDLKKNHKKIEYIWNRNKRRFWDNQPLSDSQVDCIRKLSPDYKIDTSKMTRGDASDLIYTLICQNKKGTQAR